MTRGLPNSRTTAAFIFFAILFFFSTVLNALLPGMARISAVLAVPAEAGNQLPQESLQVNNNRSFPIPSANVPPLRDSSDSIVKTSHSAEAS
jgi:hypothetical protein